MKAFIACVLVGASLFLGVGHTETLNLDQAVERALAADPRIDERRHLVDAARALLEEARGHGGLLFDANAFVGLVPGVEGGFFENDAESCTALPCTPRSDDEKFDGLSTWTSVQFQVIKPLYSFGKIERYAEAAQGNIDVKRQDLRQQRIDTRMDVTRAYYGYLTAHDNAALLREARGRAGKAAALVEEWLNAEDGRAKQSDLYALQTGQALIDKNLAQAEAIERIAMLALKVLTGAEENAELTLADAALTPVVQPETALQVWQQQALEGRPEMAQLEAGLRARRALLGAKKAERLPNLYAGVVGSLAYAPDRERLDNPHVFDTFNHAGATPVVGMKWDWAAGVQRAQVAQAQAELDALIDRSNVARRGIPFEVAEAYHTMQAERRAADAMLAGSRAARRWMVASYADFEAGVEEPAKVLEALKAYVLSYSDYLLTVNSYNLRVAQLRRVSGGFQ